MKKILTTEEVKHVAKLANLELSSAELEKYTKQLSEVIDYNIGELAKVETEKVEPVTSITGLTNVLRADETEPGFSQEEALANTKEKHNGFFKVKAILE